MLPSLPAPVPQVLDIRDASPPCLGPSGAQQGGLDPELSGGDTRPWEGL